MLTIRNKLYLGFALILAFSLGQAVVTFLYLKQGEELVHQAIGKDFNASVEIARIGIEAQKLRRFEADADRALEAEITHVPAGLARLRNALI